jgi:hypothetical protein
MPIDCSTLFSLARSKLQLSVSHKDNCSLHRWVLLKNSINSPSSLSSSAASTSDLSQHSYSEEDDDESSDEVLGSVTDHTFMFPDAGNFADHSPKDAQSSEAQWLDSLLESLGDDDDDDEFGADSDPQIATSATEDDDEHLFSPSASPLSSSDDLSHMQASSFFSSHHSVPYTAPFPSLPDCPPYKPSFDISLSALPAPYEDPLPYCVSDDVDDLAVPDAIEDTSDDESDAPQTPSLGRSTSPLSFVDAASIPLPPDRTNLRHAGFRVLFDEDSCFYPFDPLPFPTDVRSYNYYQEC